MSRKSSAGHDSSWVMRPEEVAEKTKIIGSAVVQSAYVDEDTVEVLKGLGFTVVETAGVVKVDSSTVVEKDLLEEALLDS